jgi:hypothetical protein
LLVSACNSVTRLNAPSDAENLRHRNQLHFRNSHALVRLISNFRIDSSDVDVQAEHPTSWRKASTAAAPQTTPGNWLWPLSVSLYVSHHSSFRIILIHMIDAEYTSPVLRAHPCPRHGHHLPLLLTHATRLANIPFRLAHYTSCILPLRPHCSRRAHGRAECGCAGCERRDHRTCMVVGCLPHPDVGGCDDRAELG